ncbi:hypothetical protein [Phascolarctobacterium faecium]|uniref:hypothetical protein n=1 Tax=Phascolarctobacterium faecium TaxID=33025 RepID=UPI0004292066|nr:hypothetical protein [Phascolarctobacterium faecium]
MSTIYNNSKRFNKSNYAGQIDDVNNKTPIPIVISYPCIIGGSGTLLTCSYCLT